MKRKLLSMVVLRIIESIFILLVIIFSAIMLFTPVHGVVVYIDNGYNRTFINNEINSINESYFVGLHHIWVSNDWDHNNNIGEYYSWIYGKNKIESYRTGFSYITIYMGSMYVGHGFRCTLLHELGHHKGLQQFNLSEEFADKFMYQNGCAAWN